MQPNLTNRAFPAWRRTSCSSWCRESVASVFPHDHAGAASHGCEDSEGRHPVPCRHPARGQEACPPPSRHGQRLCQELSYLPVGSRPGAASHRQAGRACLSTSPRPHRPVQHRQTRSRRTHPARRQLARCALNNFIYVSDFDEIAKVLMNSQNSVVKPQIFRS